MLHNICSCPQQQKNLESIDMPTVSYQPVLVIHICHASGKMCEALAFLYHTGNQVVMQRGSSASRRGKRNTSLSPSHQQYPEDVLYNSSQCTYPRRKTLMLNHDSSHDGTIGTKTNPNRRSLGKPNLVKPAGGNPDSLYDTVDDQYNMYSMPDDQYNFYSTIY